MAEFDDQIEAIVRALQRSNRLLFVTGAGISADSGIPTYRGIGGLYDVDETPEGFSIEEIVSGSMLQSDPVLCWKYLAQIGEAVRGASHNRAHEVIAAMEDRFDSVCVVTQNVDGFHSQAGSTNVIEIHGNMNRLYCMDCGLEVTVGQFLPTELPPRCLQCRGVLRPSVVLFGEALPTDAFNRLQMETSRGFDAVFAIGTSSLFPYIHEPILLASQMGIPTIEINPGQTDLSGEVDVAVKRRAAPTLDAIWHRYLQT